MTNELQINIAPNGEQFSLILKAEILNTEDGGQPYELRKPWDLDDLKVQTLRLGAAPPDLVRDVTVTVSRWLLDPDLNNVIANALNLSKKRGEPLRVVFSVNDHELRRKLNRLPLELVTLRNTADALVLSPEVVSIVHQLPGANKSTAPARSNRWPLKILIVRTNPNDLGGAIPAASEIRDSILKIWNEHPPLDPTLLRIDVLSHAGEEPAGMKLAGKPTSDDFEKQLLKSSYDILLYIGHGDVEPSSTPGGVGGGFLQFENEKRTGPSAYKADALAAKLARNPVPVVLLMGCVTAVGELSEVGVSLAGEPKAVPDWLDALPEDKKKSVPEALPNWILGNQGVAQALINSAAGVQFALGMQYQIPTTGAKRFLEFFFLSLLKNKDINLRGNVEEAVRVARGSLRPEKYRYLWSAPVIFSTLSAEPLLPFLQKPPVCQPFDDLQTFRETLWMTLHEAAWRHRKEIESTQSMVKVMHNSLANLEQDIARRSQEHNASLIIPGFAEAKAGDEVRVPVMLHGDLKDLKTIEGKLTGLEGMKVKALEVSAELKARDFQVAPTNTEMTEFLFRHREGGDLTTGELFTLVLIAGQEPKGWVSIGLDELIVDPAQPVCPGHNAVVFPKA